MHQIQVEGNFNQYLIMFFDNAFKMSECVNTVFLSLVDSENEGV